MDDKDNKSGEVGRGMSHFMRIVSYSQSIYQYLLFTDTKRLRPSNLPKFTKLARGSNSVSVSNTLICPLHYFLRPEKKIRGSVEA